MVKASLRRKRYLKQAFVERNAQSQLEKKKMLTTSFSKEMLKPAVVERDVQSQLY
jgi:hypothetical protein